MPKEKRKGKNRHCPWQGTLQKKTVVSEPQPGTSSQDSASGDFQIGQFLTIVEEGSTLSRPVILIGQIHFSRRRQSFTAVVTAFFYIGPKNLLNILFHEGKEMLVKDNLCIQCKKLAGKQRVTGLREQFTSALSVKNLAFFANPFLVKF